MSKTVEIKINKSIRDSNKIIEIVNKISSKLDEENKKKMNKLGIGRKVLTPEEKEKKNKEKLEKFKEEEYKSFYALTDFVRNKIFGENSKKYGVKQRELTLNLFKEKSNHYIKMKKNLLNLLLSLSAAQYMSFWILITKSKEFCGKLSYITKQNIKDSYHILKYIINDFEKDDEELTIEQIINQQKYSTKIENVNNKLLKQKLNKVIEEALGEEESGSSLSDSDEDEEEEEENGEVESINKIVKEQLLENFDNNTMEMEDEV